jgi:succinate dehydrogenase/fumarate reductase-like Fe-S protein
MHPLLLLHDLVPELLVERRRYLGPPSLLQAYRWIADSRDEATGERLDSSRTRSGSIAATRS